MGGNCLCKVCGQPTDCGGELCELCECYVERYEGVQMTLPRIEEE